MARTRTISDERITGAAREVFLAGGFGASTAEIARRAGASEALLFKRFGTKEELFAAAMGVDETPRWVHEIDALVGKGAVSENLLALSLMIIDFLRVIIPRQMMVWSARTKPPLKREMRRPPLRRDLKVLTRYFEREMDLGRIRRFDPEVAARVVLGALLNYVFSELIHPGARRPTDPGRYARRLVDVLWRGLAPVPARGGEHKGRIRRGPTRAVPGGRGRVR
jgi:AcrR family transcriptional regulator